MPVIIVLALLTSSSSLASLWQDAGFYLDQGLSADSRVAIVKSIAASMERKYAFWEIKAGLLGKSSRDHLSTCANRERNIESSTRLGFEERVRLCLGAFQDTHLQSKAQVGRAFVWAGAEIGELNGEFRLQRVSRTIQALHPLLKPGAKVLSVNGVPPEAWIAQLAPNISASSLSYRRRAALRAVLHRDFAYPLKASVRILLEGGIVELPWWQTGINQRSDLRELFTARGIRHISALDGAIEERIKAGSELVGFSEETPLPSPEPLAEFLTDRGEIGLRIGELGGEKPACYVQLLTFSSRTWRPSFASRISVSFETPLASFAAACERKAMPLILDLRFNPGGDPELARKVIEVFGRPGATQGGLLFSARRTEHTEQLLESYLLGDGYPDTSGLLSPMRLRPEALRLAEKSRDTYLPWVSQEPILTPKEKGFSGPIVALISPFCISTCEIAAGLMASSKRARIFGEPTNGTGGRFLEIGESPSASWRDDLHGTVSVKIPNTIFAVEPGTEGGAEPLRSFQKWFHLLRENRPLPPDELLSPSSADPGSQGSDFLNSVRKVLAR